MRLGYRRDDRGVAVVLVLGAVAVLTTFALIGGGAVALVLAHRKAQAAADLAALAGAAALQTGRPGCVAAQSVAVANGAQLRTCSVRGAEIVVTVVVRAPAVLGQRQLQASARAGPGSSFGS